jgi:hypothetical protein
MRVAVIGLKETARLWFAFATMWFSGAFEE